MPALSHIFNRMIYYIYTPTLRALALAVHPQDA